MKLSEYNELPDTEHEKQGQLPLEVNAVYIGNDTKTINIYFTREQLEAFYENACKKFDIIEKVPLDNTILQVWSTSGHVLNFGINSEVKRHRRTV